MPKVMAEIKHPWSYYPVSQVDSVVPKEAIQSSEMSALDFLLKYADRAMVFFDYLAPDFRIGGCGFWE